MVGYSSAQDATIALLAGNAGRYPDPEAHFILAEHHSQAICKYPEQIKTDGICKKYHYDRTGYHTSNRNQIITYILSNYIYTRIETDF